MTKDRATLGLMSAWLTLALCACMDSEDADSAAESATGDDQTPPTGAASVDAWLAQGSYKSWHCEPTVHAARAPSPHGYNRICSNDLIANDATGSGDWPRGAASVKELFTSETAGAPSGYAVYLKTADDSKAGASWYWYERLPSGRVAADGLGTDGPAKSVCVACHLASGSDPAHTPSPGGRDQVYTPVK